MPSGYMHIRCLLVAHYAFSLKTYSGYEMNFVGYVSTLRKDWKQNNIIYVATPMFMDTTVVQPNNANV
jgi:hypothetical protein